MATTFLSLPVIDSVRASLDTGIQYKGLATVVDAPVELGNSGGGSMVCSRSGASFFGLVVGTTTDVFDGSS